MPVIYVNLTTDGGAPTLTGFNNILGATQQGTGTLVADLLDENGASTGITLAEGAVPFNLYAASFAASDQSPDPDFPNNFFIPWWNSSTAGERFVLSGSGISAGQEYTIELAGQNPNQRDTLFIATDGSGTAQALYDVLPDPDPDPYVATQPVLISGTANESGEIRISTDEANTVWGYCNGFRLTFAENTTTITNINTNNEFTPGAANTLNGTNLSETGGSIVIGTEAQTITNRTSTAITFTGVRGGNPYNTDLTLTYTDADSNEVTQTVQQVPAEGFAVTAASPNTTDDASLWADTVDTATGDPATVENGDQFWVNSTIPGLAIDPTGAITANETGTFTGQFWKASEGVWGSDQTVSFTLPAEATDNWPFGKAINPIATKNWTWGSRHPMTGMRVRIFK